MQECFWESTVPFKVWAILWNIFKRVIVSVISVVIFTLIVVGAKYINHSAYNTNFDFVQALRQLTYTEQFVPLALSLFILMFLSGGLGIVETPSRRYLKHAYYKVLCGKEFSDKVMAGKHEQNCESCFQVLVAEDNRKKAEEKQRLREQANREILLIERAVAKKVAEDKLEAEKTKMKTDPETKLSITTPSQDAHKPSASSSNNYKSPVTYVPPYKDKGQMFMPPSGISQMFRP